MKISLRKSGSTAQAGQTLVYFVSTLDKKKKFSAPGLDGKLIEMIQASIDEDTFSGKKKETLFFRQANVAGYTHVLVVGVGDSKGFGAEEARVATATAVKALQGLKMPEGVFDLDTLFKMDKDVGAIAKGVAESLILTTYEFTEHKSKPAKGEEKISKPHTIFAQTKNLTKAMQDGFEEGELLANNTNFARWLGDFASNYLTPSILAKRVQERAKGTKVKVSVWDAAKIKKEGFGGLYGVGQGSDEEPRFIVMEYNGAAASKKPVYLVGKGLTFDTGGISIKPSANMDEMRYDMCGSAAVIGATFALAELKAKVNVVTLVAAAENMPSGKSIKPGDILVHRNGKTTEVLNTDAEGRLVLADALAYASEQKPQAIFDAATLTGAIVIALGNSHTGVFTRDTKLAKRINEASEVAGEQMWRMPVTDDHVEDMKGLHADWSNISSFKGAGSATAAAYLEQFVDKDIPYAHFDIAGTAWNVANRLPYAPRKGASGVMVRTFVELVKSYF